MDLGDADDKFWDQFAGSGSANLVTVIGLAVIWGLKKLCTRKSKCNSHFHTCCLDIDVRDETRRRGPGYKDGDTVASV